MTPNHSGIALLAAGVLMIAGCATTSTPPQRGVFLPGNAVEIDVERKLRDRPIVIVEDMLVGEPGVRVTGREVQIRGSLQGPLWIIDGMQTDSPAGVNPYDVDRMWVNASGHGYGRRGAHGVVIVTTRSR